MRKILLLIFVLIIVPCFAMSEVDILKVYDGDSVLARIDDNVFRIRLVEIDCFEGTKSNRAKWQAKKHGLSIDEVIKGGNIAGETLRKELENKKVYFEFMGIDKYHRALGFLFADGVNINHKMLESPYCKQYLY